MPSDSPPSALRDSVSDRPSSTRPARGQPSAWGPSTQQSGARRLAPLSTNIESASLGSPSRTFSSVLASSSSSSRLTPLHSAGQTPFQSSQPFAFSRSKSSAPSISSSTLDSSSAPASQGGGRGGTASRKNTFSPSLGQTGNLLNSPTTSSFDRAQSASSIPIIGGNPQPGVSKITIAQIYLLLGSISEKEGKAKWEAQAEQIRKLVESIDSDGYRKYIRRLITTSAPRIFNTGRVSENQAIYPLLVMEMEKLSKNVQNVREIAAAIYSTNDETFKDFDLAGYMEHFELDPFIRMLLALEIKEGPREELTSRANAILEKELPEMLRIVMRAPIVETCPEPITPKLFGEIIERFLESPYPGFTENSSLVIPIEQGYALKQLDMPIEVAAAMQMTDLLEKARNPLVNRIRLAGGPEVTKDVATTKAFLSTLDLEDGVLPEEQVASSLLYIVLTRNWKQYHPDIFVNALRESTVGEHINWQTVIRYFDRDLVRIDSVRFLALFDALLPIAREDENVDIQTLWGGRWHFMTSQLSFIRAFMTSAQLDLSTIPRFRSSFSLDFFADASDSVKETASHLQNSPFRSLDAVDAVMNIVFSSEQAFQNVNSRNFTRDVIQPNAGLFIVSALGLSKDWNTTQHMALNNLMEPFILKQMEGYDFVLHGAWKQDKSWVATRFHGLHMDDPMRLTVLLDHAIERGWLDDFLSLNTLFAYDLATLCYKRGMVDLKEWVERRISSRGLREFNVSLQKFMAIKAEDEIRMQTGDQKLPQTIPLTINTVYTLLELSQNHATGPEEVLRLQRSCIPAYPRLINYNQGSNEIIDANGEKSNQLSDMIDQRMQDTYGKMYRDELSCKAVLDLMMKYKTSQDAEEQDLFSCMVHGLLDEYYMYDTYPLEALKKTAVIFGGIINYKLIAGIPLQASLGMILEAVRDHPLGTPMYKFGVEALEQSLDRLHEWPGLCELLTQIPDLRNTRVLRKAQEVREDFQKNPNKSTNGDTVNGFMGDSNFQNGNSDDYESGSHSFHCLHVDSSTRDGFYEDPTEDVQDKVLFVLNNVSEQNLNSKLKDLQDVLEDRHHQWFAQYIVEQRAKVQPNFQPLYLELLDKCGDNLLWAEVLRETYVSSIRMLNADSTLNSSQERTYLKNLGSWLGSLTIARNKPIKHRNIYFKELLIEGYDTQRLLVVIPFTCKVLIQAKNSIVFKPPNPWLMDIIHVLMELYHFAELKLNLKFEIEVLCKDLDLDYKSIEPSTDIRERPPLEEDYSTTLMPGGLETFENMSLGNMERVRSERISPAAVVSSLPNLEPLLKFPTMPSNLDPDRCHEILLDAAQKAICEIIGPVVERSVTIGTIATAQLILKDFAMEPDENKMRQAAQHMAKEAAGGLALVTSKEPLRNSLNNFIRMLQDPDTPLPEGVVMMFLNDNVDIACGIIEQAAGDQAVPEIDKILEESLEARRRHRVNRPGEPFVDSLVSKWSQYIPEPYRQTPAGLNSDQLAIYEAFGRPPVTTARGHVQSTSVDNNRQLADVLIESYPAVPTLPTPAETPAVPHRVPQLLQDSRASVSSAPAPTLQTQITNGSLTAQSIAERLHGCFEELQKCAKETQVLHLCELANDNMIFKIMTQILNLVALVPDTDSYAEFLASTICTRLLTPPNEDWILESEVNIELLLEICAIFPYVNTKVHFFLQLQLKTEQIMKLKLATLITLLERSLITLNRVEQLLAIGISEHQPVALELFSGLLDATLFIDNPVAFRSSFSNALEATGKWLATEPNNALANSIVRKLRHSTPKLPDSLPGDANQAKRDQMEYIFQECVEMYRNPEVRELAWAAFIMQMNNKQIINSTEDSALFFRLCLDISVTSAEDIVRSGGHIDDAFLCVDALAKFIVLLTRYQGEKDGAVKTNNAAYLKSILSVIALVLNHYQVTQAEQLNQRFHQRVFFRLFSSLLFESSVLSNSDARSHHDLILAVAETLIFLQPANVPGFIFGWMSLVSHRKFMPYLLRTQDEQGYELFTQLILAMLSYVAELLKPVEITPVSKYIYQAVLRILLILHHDFPEFLTENHYRLCNIIPAHCSQLRNLVLSAFPSSFPELPDPFTVGLKVDRLNEIRVPPKVSGDITAPLLRGGVKDAVDDAIKHKDVSDACISKILDAIYSPVVKATGMLLAPINVDVVLINALVLYLCHTAISSADKKKSQTFSSESTEAIFFQKIAQALSPEGRYYFISAMANQLRFPNCHTHFFSYAILDFFGPDRANKSSVEVQTQVTRVLLERLIVHRPHPWGLIVSLLELLKNESYNFWELPFIKAAPEVTTPFSFVPVLSLMVSGSFRTPSLDADSLFQIQRLFSALFHHINSNPRALA